MKIGLQLHPERGVDAVFDEAREADRQGYDSIWLFDHLLDFRGKHGPDQPLDSFTLMTALGAITRRTRLAWAMLNTSFRNPAVLAKMLATLDQISHGRVICSLGAGWLEEEYRAYDIPFLEDHDERVAYAGEVARLLKQLWTHPAPERVTFAGKYVSVRDLAFNPAPCQRPHPPIWIGGESEATRALVKELANGWVMLGRGDPDMVSETLSSPDWPDRPMAVVRTSRIIVGETQQDALDTIARTIEASRGAVGMPATVEEFVQRFIVGSPDECLQQIARIESSGINYLRFSFEDADQQERVARDILSRL